MIGTGCHISFEDAYIEAVNYPITTEPQNGKFVYVFGGTHRLFVEHYHRGEEYYCKDIDGNRFIALKCDLTEEEFNRFAERAPKLKGWKIGAKL